MPLLFSSHSWRVGRESMVMAPPPMHDSAVSPCFHSFLVSSAGISHHSLLPYIPSICLSAVNSNPHPGIASQFPTAPSHCTFQGICVPVQCMYGCGKDCLILFPFRLPQISCFILSLKCSSPDSDNCLDMGIRPLLQFPTCQEQIQSS